MPVCRIFLARAVIRVYYPGSLGCLRLLLLLHHPSLKPALQLLPINYISHPFDSPARMRMRVTYYYIVVAGGGYLCPVQVMDFLCCM